MNNLFKKQTTLTKIEFWAVTTIFAFALLFHVIDIFEWDDTAFTDAPYRRFFDQVNMPFDFYRNYFIPQLTNHISQFLFVLCLNFVLIPKLLKKESLLLNIFFVVLLFAVAGIIFGITGTYLKGYLYAGNQARGAIDEEIFLNGFENALMITWVLVIYTAIKLAFSYFLAISGRLELKHRYVKKEAIVATGVWMVGLLLLRFGRADGEAIVMWALVVPSAIAFYLFSFYRLIPISIARNSYQFLSYIGKSALILFLAFLVIYLVSIFIIPDDDAGFAFSALNSFIQLFITAPLTWFLYKRHLKGNEQINVLQKELKQSTASIDFLRSQINPHFLFNALNTIYGTAIQENAERTSEGIEKLGDMMRFMLQENTHENISLARELEYLNNYISLQRLRTDTSPAISIQTEIHDGESPLQIAPMLLIPFVENAFKHGISFRAASVIKITLEVKDKTLYFDVYNSKHERQDSDPEKDNSGIGLENVRQRLKLLYPNQHELIIRETSREFFVHLTIQLK